MKILVMLACMLFSSAIFAECRNVNGKAVCGNDQEAAGYNSRSGNAWKAEQNQSGVKTIENSQGGEAKTKNGRAVYKSPNGTTCVKTQNNKGCR